MAARLEHSVMGPPALAEVLVLGISPRAYSTSLTSARVNAFQHGREHALPQDAKEICDARGIELSAASGPGGKTSARCHAARVVAAVPIPEYPRHDSGRRHGSLQHRAAQREKIRNLRIGPTLPASGPGSTSTNTGRIAPRRRPANRWNVTARMNALPQADPRGT